MAFLFVVVLGLAQDHHEQEGHGHQQGHAGVAHQGRVHRVHVGAQIDQAQTGAPLHHGHHHLGAPMIVGELQRRGLGGGLGAAASEPGRELSGLVVDPGSLQIGVGAEGVDVFLGGLAIVEGQGRGQARGQDVGLHRGLVQPLGAIAGLADQAHEHAGDQQRRRPGDGRHGPRTPPRRQAAVAHERRSACPLNRCARMTRTAPSGGRAKLGRGGPQSPRPGETIPDAPGDRPHGVQQPRPEVKASVRARECARESQAD